MSRLLNVLLAAVAYWFWRDARYMKQEMIRRETEQWGKQVRTVRR